MTILLPTSYLPPISYMARCVTADEILVEAWETYPKQTFRNHCEIHGPNGRQRLTIPVTRPDGNHTMTKDVRIASHLPWQKVHWRSFETAYNKSPFFLYYQDYLLPFYEKEYHFLLDFNMEIMETIFQAIRLDKYISTTQSYEEAPPGIVDARHPSGIRNRALSLRADRSNGFREYYQVFADRHGFLPDLSVVDLLFNLGPETSQYFS